MSAEYNFTYIPRSNGPSWLIHNNTTILCGLGTGLCEDNNIQSAIIGEEIDDGVIKITNKNTGDIYTFYAVNRKVATEEEYKKHQLIKQLAGIK